MPPGDAAAGTQLLGWPVPSGQPQAAQARADAGSAYPWDDLVPPPGQDATLLAVVPIPGTGTSLAVVGYVIATSAGSTPSSGAPGDGPARSPGPGPGDRPAPGPGPWSGLHLDHAQRRVWTDGRGVQLTFQEFELLAFLSAHPETVFTRADLVDQVWHRDLGHDGRPVPQDSRTVDVHVSRLRRKLGPRHGQCLVTEYRVGYRFRPLAR